MSDEDEGSRDTAETTDASETRSVKRRQKWATFDRAEELADLQSILVTKRGRAFLWRLLSEAGIYKSSFAGEQPHLTAWREGRRHIGLWTLAEIMAANKPAYMTMVQEAEALDEHKRVRK